MLYNSICGLIETHMNRDEQGFLYFARLIAEYYCINGEEQKSKCIRHKIGDDSEEIEFVVDTDFFTRLLDYCQSAISSIRKNLEETGEIHKGDICIHGEQ